MNKKTIFYSLFITLLIGTSFTTSLVGMDFISPDLHDLQSLPRLDLRQQGPTIVGEMCIELCNPKYQADPNLKPPSYSDLWLKRWNRSRKNDWNGKPVPR